MTAIVPDPNTPICALDLPPPSERVREALSRMAVFLFGVMEPHTKVRALLAGYTPNTHGMGVYLTEHLAGERPFFEWRIHYSLKPPRDPDLPELVAELDAFRKKWLPVAMRAAANTSDRLDRLELQDLLRDPVDKPSRVWRARAWVSITKRLKKVNVNFYQAAWAELVRAGFEDELPRFEEAMKTVEAYIRDAPLEDLERKDIASAREATARNALSWLDERRTQLEKHLDEETRTVLGLGELVPPRPPPFPVAVALRWRAEQN